MDAKKLIIAIGGKDNIDSVTHCLTRLRFNLKDLDIVNNEEAKSVQDVIGLQVKGGQLQVIMQGSIEKHYKEVMDELGEEVVKATADDKPEKKEKFGFNTLVNHLSAILSPAIAAIAGGGLLKAFYFALTTFKIIESTSSIAFILNMLADAVFFYLPFLLAYTSAKRFKTDIPLAMTMAGVLMYPSFMNLAAEGGTLSLFGIPVLVANYKASVVPIILTVWFLSIVHKQVKKIVPASLSIVLVPLLTLLIVGFISLIVLAPIGFYIADFISVLVEKVVTFTPFVSGFIIGAIRPFLVLTGMHHILSPINLQQLEMSGHSALGAISLMSTFAQASAALAYWIFAKSKEEKQLGASTTITGYIGITEPILFGILVPNRDLFFITMFSGGLAAGIATQLGAVSYGFVMPGLLSLAAYMGDGFIGIIVGSIVAVVSTVTLYGLKVRKDTR